MKKILFILLVVCCYSKLSTGQVNIIDNIDLGPTAMPLRSLPPGDWGTTHGTPDYVPTELAIWSMYSNMGKQGEGIYRAINFTDQTYYEVILSLTFSNPHSGVEYFEVRLANDPLPTPGNSSGEPIPTLTSRLLYTYSGYSFTNKLLSLKFATAVGEYWQYLVIYPRSEVYDFAPIQLRIDCLRARSYCAGPDLVHCSGQFPSGTHTRKSISIGSSLCSGTPVTSVASSNTTLRAAQYIDVKPQTTISVNPGKVFDMGITPCSQAADNIAVNQVVASLYDGQSPCAITINTETDLSLISNEDFNIFPNPTSGKFRISFTTPIAQGELSVLTPEGREVVRVKVDGFNTEVDLSGMSSGMYFVRYANGDKIITKKLIKTK